jgi:hypothetical protein
MPYKKYVRSSTIRWSWFEVALIDYLRDHTKRDMGDHLRAALRFYLRHLPDFDPKGFAKYAKDEVLPKIKKDTRQEEFKQQVDAFLEAFDREAPEGGEFDRISSFEDRSTSFKSSASDFDLE